MNSDWTKRFEPDGHTVVLYRFDEGEGNEAHDATGDPQLTLRAKDGRDAGRRRATLSRQNTTEPRGTNGQSR